MPMPTEERVSQLVAGLVERRGLDLEGVTITAAAPARVQVVVDSDDSMDLDAVAELSTDISAALDDAGDFGATPYLLEVTTPGVDRPLTEPRHWRRARGRKVRIGLRPGAAIPEEAAAGLEARVGAVTGTEVDLVLRGKRQPRLVTVPLADIERAVVQVEFAPAPPAELALAGGVAPGRPEPGAEEQDQQGASQPVAPTEGIVE
jgi:ribosome maturation factor RimP